MTKQKSSEQDHFVSGIMREIDEELHTDKMAALWKQYGTYILGGISAILIIVAGYAYYQKSMQQADQAYTTELIRAIETAQTDKNKAQDLFNDILKSRGIKRAYLAKFYQAFLNAEQKNTQASLDLYKELAYSGDVPPLYRDLARYYYILHSDKILSVDEKLNELRPLLSDKSPWFFYGREQEILLLIEKEDKAQALTLINEIEENEDAPLAIRQRLHIVKSVNW